MEFWLEEHQSWNPQLKQVVKKEQLEGPGLSKTNKGGWHSDKSLHRKTDPSVQTLVQHIRQSLSEWAMATFVLEERPEAEKWDIELWANINGKGHFNKAHDHFRSGIVASGCYYLQTNDRMDEGRIIFLNQLSLPDFTESAMRPRQQSFAISPRDGQYLIFPSWLGHLVEPHSYDGERISLAFNAGHPSLMVRRKGDRLVREKLRKLLK